MRRGGRINRGAHRAALHAAARPRPADSANRGAHRTPPPPSLAQVAALIREKARPAGKGPRGPGGGPRAAVPADLVAGDAGRRTGCARARFRGRREFRRCPWRAPDGARSAGWRGSMRMQGAGMPCSHGAGACGRNLDESETRLGCGLRRCRISARGDCHWLRMLHGWQDGMRPRLRPRSPLRAAWRERAAQAGGRGASGAGRA